MNQKIIVKKLTCSLIRKNKLKKNITQQPSIDLIQIRKIIKSPEVGNNRK
jgi:hypothetical protein